eukprot:g6175.t1
MLAGLAVLAEQLRALRAVSAFAVDMVLMYPTDTFNIVDLRHEPKPADVLRTFRERDRPRLEALGWAVREVQPPVRIDDLAGTGLHAELTSRNAERTGCCGTLELCKLEPLRWTEYEKVMVIDVDTLLVPDAATARGRGQLRDLDELFHSARDALFWASCNMWSVDPTVNGGLLVLRPSRRDYASITAIARRGNFSLEGWHEYYPVFEPTGGGESARGSAGRVYGYARERFRTVQALGWERSGWGAGYGGSTIQGLIPFYYVAHRRDAGWDFVDPCRFHFMGAGLRHEYARAREGAGAAAGADAAGARVRLPDRAACVKADVEGVCPAGATVVTAHLTGWHLTDPDLHSTFFNATCHAPWRCRLDESMRPVARARREGVLCYHFIRRWRELCERVPLCLDFMKGALHDKSETCAVDYADDVSVAFEA